VLLLADDPHVAGEQLRAILTYLITLSHVDGEYSPVERDFVARRLRGLVAHYVHTHHASLPPLERNATIDGHVGTFALIADDIVLEVRAMLDEAVLAREGSATHVADKLRIRSAEILASFDAEARAELLQACDELILADGVVHPAEQRLRQDVEALLAAAEGPPPRPLPPARITFAPMQALEASPRDLDLFSELEIPLAQADKQLKRELASEQQRVRQVSAELAARRAHGHGSLDGTHDVGELADRGDFLDGWVQHLDSRQPLDLTVLGDLHGCYGCLKAAVLQADFLGRLARWREQPEQHPRPVLIMLGDYVDRGRYSFEGVLRAALTLYLHAPDNVVLLRGNHEHYRVLDGKVRGMVSPAEAIEITGARFPEALLVDYMSLFEALPSIALVDRCLFVHAGIPRDATMARRFRGLADLNDAELRFEMAWSDPTSARSVPSALQASSSRFSFGRQQFLRFMGELGSTLLVRGHQTVEEGVRLLYAGAPAQLLNVFSAGGAVNEDLPETSPYRRLRPAALRMMLDAGAVTTTPYPIDYGPYVVPGGNQFYAPR
jgi:hypothetical protein